MRQNHRRARDQRIGMSAQHGDRRLGRGFENDGFHFSDVAAGKAREQCRGDVIGSAQAGSHCDAHRSGVAAQARCKVRDRLDRGFGLDRERNVFAVDQRDRRKIGVIVGALPRDVIGKQYRANAKRASA